MKFQLIISGFYTLFAIPFFAIPIFYEITLRTTMLFGIAGLLCLILSRLWLFPISDEVRT